MEPLQATGHESGQTDADEDPVACLLPMRGQVQSVQADGRLVVATAQERQFVCDWLESHLTVGPRIAAGDTVLIMADPISCSGIVVGRVGPRAGGVPNAHLSIESVGQLTLVCGQASIDLRADGKVMIRGEDVLVRAKGTQRIRAGTVSIN